MKFEFENNENLECVELDGQPLFNPYDVGKCLELPESTVRNHMAKMNDNQKVLLKVHELDFLPEDSKRDMSRRGAVFLTESGVYKLAFKSRSEKAEEFSDWVADEVLPQIRKTGKFSLSKTDTMEINSSLNALQQHNIVNPYEVATANNQSHRAKLSNLINDIAKRDHRKPSALYNELYHVFAAKSGVYIPEQADLEGKSPSRYLRKPDKAVLSENLYHFAVNYFYQGKSVFELINLDPAQKTLGEF